MVSPSPLSSQISALSPGALRNRPLVPRVPTCLLSSPPVRCFNLSSPHRPAGFSSPSQGSQSGLRWWKTRRFPPPPKTPAGRVHLPLTEGLKGSLGAYGGSADSSAFPCTHPAPGPLLPGKPEARPGSSGVSTRVGDVSLTQTFVTSPFHAVFSYV